MIEAKYTLSEETLLEGFELHFQYKRPFLKYYPYLGILVLLIATVTFNRFDNKVFVPALLMGLMFLGTPFLVRFLNRKSIKRLPTLGHETFWQFDANNISATTQEGDFFTGMGQHEGCTYYPPWCAHLSAKQHLLLAA